METKIEPSNFISNLSVEYIDIYEIFNLQVFIYCLLVLGIIVGILYGGRLLMERHRGRIVPLDDRDVSVRRRNLDITYRLVNQQRENNHRVTLGLPRLAYNQFPPGHYGHLNEERQIRLVQIIESNPIAMGIYRPGSMLGGLYLRGTYSHPSANYYMIFTVFISESNRD